MPIPVYYHIYSNEEQGFDSTNTETLLGLDFVKKTFGKRGIFALDRGFDASLFFEYFTKNNLNFVMCCKSNRNVICKSKEVNIQKLANQLEKQYSCITELKNKKKQKLKFIYVEIELCRIKNKALTLVVIEGLGKKPLMMITNLKIEFKELT